MYYLSSQEYTSWKKNLWDKTNENKSKEYTGSQSTHYPFSCSAQPNILCTGANTVRETTGKCVMVRKYGSIYILMVTVKVLIWSFNFKTSSLILYYSELFCFFIYYIEDNILCFFCFFYSIADFHREMVLSSKTLSRVVNYRWFSVLL